MRDRSDRTPGALIHAAASKAKSLVLTPLPAKLYWHLMGRFRAVRAVTSDFATLEESLASGRQVADLLAAVTGIGPDSDVLNIGSGLGRVEAHLAPRVRRCCGADISPAMVAKAGRLVQFPNVEFRCTDGGGLSEWDDQSFDLVFSIFVFQHLPREQVGRYLNQSFAKLRPGGQILFQVMIDESREFKEPPKSHPYALRRYRRLEVIGLLQEIGFNQIRILEMDGAPDRAQPTGDIIFLARKPEPVPNNR
jgi:SAM-dependent methyltransferase